MVSIRMRFFLSVYERDRGLAATARQVWRGFGDSGMHPRGRRMPDLIGPTDFRVGDYAGVFVSDRSINLVLATELLTQSSELEQRLTLLHECIHIDFALGDHRDRWRRMNDRVERRTAEIDGAVPTGQHDVHRDAYLRARSDSALLFLRLPDEIVAEQYLKHAFPQWFAERAQYYVRMRQRREAIVTAPGAHPTLRPLQVFYELLRIALYIPLVADVPALDATHRELTRLERHAEDRLSEIAAPQVVDMLIELKPRLLDVSFDRSFAEAETQYDALCAKIITLE